MRKRTSALLIEGQASKDLVEPAGVRSPLDSPSFIFYEVMPYHVVIEEANSSPAATRHIIQAGFDVDVHGLSNKDEVELPPPGDYALGYER